MEELKEAGRVERNVMFSQRTRKETVIAAWIGKGAWGKDVYTREKGSDKNFSIFYRNLTR